jgi:hypothetical protein
MPGVTLLLWDDPMTTVPYYVRGNVVAVYDGHPLESLGACEREAPEGQVSPFRAVFVADATAADYAHLLESVVEAYPNPTPGMPPVIQTLAMRRWRVNMDNLPAGTPYAEVTL